MRHNKSDNDVSKRDKMGTLNPDLLTQQMRDILDQAATLQHDRQVIAITPEVILYILLHYPGTAAAQILATAGTYPGVDLDKFRRQLVGGFQSSLDQASDLNFMTNTGGMAPLSRFSIVLIDDALSLANSMDEVMIDTDHILRIAAETALPTSALLRNSGISPQLLQQISNNVPLVQARLKNKIFISYRRGESIDIAGRIYDRLIGAFPRNSVFKDVDNIPLGVDFREILKKELELCSVLLAIVGKNWLTLQDSSGRRRLDNPSDFVRLEIETALSLNIPVIPVLVQDATIPSEDALPESLRPLVYRNGLPIRPDPDFHRDMDRLIRGIKQIMSQRS
jgi:hypothetical protein